MFPFTTLSHPTSDVRHPTLLLHTSQGTRYLFGKVPEGLQRSLNEQKKRVSKVSGVFLTGELNWESIGGLPGLILTISDQGKKDLNVFYGTSFLNYVISTWRSFVFRFGMNLETTVIPNGEIYSDNIMAVQSMVLNAQSEAAPRPSISESVSAKLKSIVSQMFPLDVKNTYSAKEGETFDKDQSDPKLTNSYIHAELPNLDYQKSSTCYSIQLHKLRGKFMVEKAIELGVPKGKQRGILASGSPITLPDGTTVRPDQVLSEERHFEKILLIDIPSECYLKSAKETKWGENVGIVYHLLGNDIDPFGQEYREFIDSFGSECTQFISHPSYCPDSIVFKGHADLTLKLKALHLKHFNLPRSSTSALSLPSDASKNLKVLIQGQTTSIGCTPLSARNVINIDEAEVPLRTQHSWDQSFNQNVVKLNPKYTKAQILEANTVSALSVDPDVSLKDQVETITLGTGSALPSRYRNVVSTLVRIPYKRDSEVSFRSILLDAGENTIGSIRRSLGNENMPMYFRELKFIYLSHLHADHHLGIVSIIKAWLEYNKENNEKLYLVTPWQYNKFVNEWMRFDSAESLDRLSYISCEDFLSGRARYETEPIPFQDFEVGEHHNLRFKPFHRNIKAIRSFFADVGIEKFSTCRAIHCEWSYSCAITLKLDETAQESSLFKVSYSGDTRPNYFMFAEKIGQGSDLLIHEATLENDLLEEAKKKRHSTMNEAIKVSNSMNAKKLILTHFSQRYPHLPKISENIKVNAEYCIAFDMMINKYSDIGDQLEIMDQLNEVFAPELFDIDDTEE